jgi:hypothetical protein
MSSANARPGTRSIVLFFVVAFAITWALLPLMRISQLFGLVALFGPAAAAFVAAWYSGDPEGTKRLAARVLDWRVGIGPYLWAVGLPVGLSLLVALIGDLRAGSFGTHLGPVNALMLVVFVLVVGEEVGWRGFAQPALAARLGPVRAALVVGVLWGLRHLPTFYMDGLPQRAIPFGAFMVFTVAFSVVAGWLAQRSRGSVAVATVLHGVFNTVIFLTPALDTAGRYWVNAVVWTVAAGVTALGVKWLRLQTTV